MNQRTERRLVWVCKGELAEGLAAVVAMGVVACSTGVKRESSTDGGARTSGLAGIGGAPAAGGSGGVVSDAGRSGTDSAAPLDVAGSVDASNNPSPEAGAAGCSGIFCEDFELGQLDINRWDLKMGAGGTEEIQQQIVAHGKYAWHVHSTGARGDFAMILTKSAPPSLRGAGPVYGRAYLYTTPNKNPHVELGFAGTAGYPNLNYMEFAEFGGGSWQLGFDLFTPAPSVAKGFVEEASYTHPGGQQIPVMKWSCIEWEFGDDPDLMVLWVDGQQIDQFDVQHVDYSSVPKTAGSVLNGKSSNIIGGFSVFGLGFHDWGSANSFDLYYDDLVLDSHRVGCLSGGGPSGG